MILRGKSTDVAVYASIIEDAAIDQLNKIANNEAYCGCKIAVMPDTHAGKGCVVGFTMQYSPERPVINPNIVGVDIGCGMLVQPLDVTAIDLERFDAVVRSCVNLEKGYHFQNDFFAPLDTPERPYSYHDGQIGTLGYGNHFVEIDRGQDGRLYLVVHSGSRNLGLRVCNHYARRTLPESDILSELDVRDYLHDMELAQRYATLNREVLATEILADASIPYNREERYETRHNYIDIEHSIIRKGAISAQRGERVLIPLNMRDGSIVALGKGNPDWNFSAPHGAGRAMSRGAARSAISLDDFRASMDGIFTTCVGTQTLDEAPAAYKDASVILQDIAETVDIIERIVPIYNYKNA